MTSTRLSWQAVLKCSHIFRSANLQYHLAIGTKPVLNLTDLSFYKTILTFHSDSQIFIHLFELIHDILLLF